MHQNVAFCGKGLRKAQKVYKSENKSQTNFQLVTEKTQWNRQVVLYLQKLINCLANTSQT